MAGKTSNEEIILEHEKQAIEQDRMRYTKNKTSSNFTALAIVFDVMYFIGLYKIDRGVYYYNILIGASIIYNLIFMLTAFLCMEGVKNYKKNFSYVLSVLGLIQIIRIFIIPMKAKATTLVLSGETTPAMSAGRFTYCLLTLVLSAACLFFAAFVGYTRSVKLEKYLSTIGPEARRD